LNPEIYSLRITVPASAIDERNHVNNLTYLQWCVDAAQDHWERNASEALRKKYVWFVLRHEIDYKNPSFEGEALQIDTWVATAEGVRSKRCYRIFRITDKKLLVEASTDWCLLAADTLKPTNITEEIRTLFEEK
jgi:acyl-CoA thioester hydrolase